MDEEKVAQQMKALQVDEGKKVTLRLFDGPGSII